MSGERRQGLWILVGIVGLGAILRFTGLDDQSLWGDERFTIVVLAGDGFWDVPSQVYEQSPPRRSTNEVVLVGFEGPDRGDPCWWGTECGIPGLEVPLSVPGWRTVETRREGSFTVVRMRAPEARYPPTLTNAVDAGWYTQAGVVSP